jgi:dipeptidyl aminopeptidase/acylaminoacyl peptidase
MIDLKSSTYNIPQLPPIDNPAPSIQRVSDEHYVFIGSTKDKPEALYSIISKGQPELTVLKSSLTLPISSAYFSVLMPICFPRTHNVELGGVSYALFMPPRNPNYIGREDTLPPLILYMHGGPTIHIGPGLSISWQYWTTRGYAMVAVNYTGSSGYSRAYRSQLDGQWGIADVADAASCVDYLATAGLIDKTRVGIVGGSAGGYACLQALCSYPDKFAGGVSLYGISDLKALIQDTHKFESRYADRLLFGADGKLSDKEKEDILYERSPLYHAEKIKAPTLLLQGLEDKTVPPNQAERMIDVIKKHNGNAKVVFFEGEGHGFSKAESVERSIVEQEQWWRKTLVRHNHGSERL